MIDLEFHNQIHIIDSQKLNYLKNKALLSVEPPSVSIKPLFPMQKPSGSVLDLQNQTLHSLCRGHLGTLIESIEEKEYRYKSP